MDPLGIPLPTAWTLAGWVLAVAVVARAAQRAPWRRFSASEPANVWFGAILFVLMLWSLQGTVGEGFTSIVTMAAVPVTVTWLVLRFAEARLPPNFFVYVFVGAFFGAGLAYAAAGIAGAAVLVLGAGRPPALVFGEYAPYLIYLAFGEATLTGMVLTLAIVYRPQWVVTFDDARYLEGR